MTTHSIDTGDISGTTITIDGSSTWKGNSIVAGDVFEIDADTYNCSLIIDNMPGSAGNEIVFTNAGGLVTFVAPVTRDNCILVRDNNNHVIFDGSGDGGFTYGIVITVEPVELRDRWTFVYFRWMEFDFSSGTERGLFNSQLNFTSTDVNDLYVEDCWFHDLISDEGIYAGTNDVSGTDFNITNIYVRRTLFEDCGEGVNIKHCPGYFEIVDCEFRRVIAGSDSRFFAAINIFRARSAGSNGFIERNLFFDCDCNAIRVQENDGDPAFDVFVQNNVIYNCSDNNDGRSDLNQGIRASTTGPTVLVVNNTLRNIGNGVDGRGISLGEARHFAYNNIVLESDDEDIRRSGSVPAGNTYNNLTSDTSGGDSTTRTVASIDFVNEALNDYQLEASSPAVDAGTAVDAPTDDYLQIARDASPDIGAYEHSPFSLSEESTVSDTVVITASVTGDVAIDEGVTVSETVDLDVVVSAVIEEAVTVADAISLDVETNAVIEEAVTIADVVTVESSTVVLILAESVTLAEDVIVNAVVTDNISLVVSEAIAISDQAVPESSAVIMVTNDEVAVSEVSLSDSEWWASGSVAESDVIGAWTFRYAFTAAEALRNQINPGTYDLVAAPTYALPTWTFQAGFQLDGIDDVLDTGVLTGDNYTVIIMFRFDQSNSSLQEVFGAFNLTNTSFGFAMAMTSGFGGGIRFPTTYHGGTSRISGAEVISDTDVNIARTFAFNRERFRALEQTMFTWTPSQWDVPVDTLWLGVINGLESFQLFSRDTYAMVIYNRILTEPEIATIESSMLAVTGSSAALMSGDTSLVVTDNVTVADEAVMVVDLDLVLSDAVTASDSIAQIAVVDLVVNEGIAVSSATVMQGPFVNILVFEAVTVADTVVIMAEVVAIGIALTVVDRPTVLKILRD